MKRLMKSAIMFSTLGLVAISLSACLRPADTHMGMVVDEETGLMYGSAIENNLVTDASFYSNRKIKVRTRNTSGDTAFGLTKFKSELDSSYADKGYEPMQDTTEEDFGLLMDVNVMYSGQIQTNRAMEYSLVGSLLGATYGGTTQRGMIVGTVAGAELGNIIGSFDTQDTYMVVANVTFAVLKPYKSNRKTITFSRSEKLKDINDPSEEDVSIRRKMQKTYSTQIAVYAGGRNVSQSEITEQVRQRMVNIVADFI